MARHLILRPVQRLLRQLSPAISTPTRNYISEMRKEAFQGNILRLLRNEIQYQFDRYPLPEPVPEYKSFMVDERAGEQWIRLNKKFGEKEEIKVDVTMFDGSVPVKKGGEDEVVLHLTMVVDIFKGEGNDVLEFVCSAWPESIEIHKVIMRGHGPIADQLYTGPPFKELDDKLQDELYNFLETRGIDDDLAVFLHQYMKNKDKIEYVRWMAKTMLIIEKK